jgi:hypothetical protein
MFPMESNFLLIWKWSPCKIGTEIYALNRAQTLIACELCGSQAGLQKYHWYQEILVIASCCPTSRAASTWDPQDPRNHLYRLCPALLDLLRLQDGCSASVPCVCCPLLCFIRLLPLFHIQEHKPHGCRWWFLTVYPLFSKEKKVLHNQIAAN